ncbi:MAG: hypothetical protein HYX59_04175 [Elusimicrobia bacterium]|nr:hypothetical protein [Elusimicrobiota bacterium]
MRPFPLVFLAALLGAAAPAPARAGVGRAVEVALPGEATTFKTGSSPAVTLQLTPVAGLTAPGLAPALAAPLAPALQAPTPLAPSALTPAPAALTAAALPAPAAPVKTVDALRRTGTALTEAAPASDGASREIANLFDGGGARAADPAGVTASPGVSRAPALAPSAPRPARRMPEGVKRAFQNSAVLGGGIAALSGALYAWTQSLVSAPSPAMFAVLAAPLLLVPFHFALVSGFWAGRYYAYPKLSPAAKSAFETAWRAVAVAYPVAALAMVAAWFQIIGSNPAVLAVMGLPALVALGEVTHHFIYRVVPERAQDKGKPLTDWRSRVGGNIGQQLRRMRRKP